MIRLSAIFCLSLTLGAPVWADINVAPSQLGFGYCSPPVIPDCIAQTATHRPGRSTLESCSSDVLRFTQSLGAYRACLTRESERAIGTGNAAIARFRCLAQGGRGCR